MTCFIGSCCPAPEVSSSPGTANGVNCCPEGWSCGTGIAAPGATESMPAAACRRAGCRGHPATAAHGAVQGPASTGSRSGPRSRKRDDARARAFGNLQEVPGRMPDPKGDLFLASAPSVRRAEINFHHFRHFRRRPPVHRRKLGDRSRRQWHPMVPRRTWFPAVPVRRSCRPEMAGLRRRRPEPGRTVERGGQAICGPAAPAAGG